MFFIFYVKDYQKLCLNHFHIMTTLALKALGFLVPVKHHLIFYADLLKLEACRTDNLYYVLQNMLI